MRASHPEAAGSEPRHSVFLRSAYGRKTLVGAPHPEAADSEPRQPAFLRSAYGRKTPVGAPHPEAADSIPRHPASLRSAHERKTLVGRLIWRPRIPHRATLRLCAALTSERPGCGQLRLG